MLYSFPRNNSNVQHNSSVRNSATLGYLYLLIATILFLVVSCVFTWKFVRPDGEFAVIVAIAGLAVLWLVFGIVVFMLGARTLKKIFIYGLFLIQLLMILAWIFMLVNLIQTPRFYDKCCKRHGSRSGSGSGGHHHDHHSSSYLECERYYYKKWAWALAWVIWIFLDIFLFRFFVIHYLLKEYYSDKYSRELQGGEKGCGSSPEFDLGCNPTYCPPTQQPLMRSEMPVSGQPLINCCNGPACTINSQFPSSAVRSYRMSDVDSIIVS